MQLFTQIQQKATSLLTENSSALLTAGGVIGTVATAVLAGRASITAHRLLDMAQVELEESIDEESPNSTPDPELSKTEKFKIAAPHFIAPVLVGTATIASIVMANRVSAQHAAALAAAYTVSSKQRDEYKAKLEEKLGVRKAEQATDEIQQARIDKRPPDNNIIIVGTGPVLCYDAFSDRYFKSTAEHIRRAALVVNGEIDTGHDCKLATFYNELELPDVPFGDMLGWNAENPCRITISAMMMNDDACLCLEFVNLPFPNYAMDYS